MSRNTHRTTRGVGSRSGCADRLYGEVEGHRGGAVMVNAPFRILLAVSLVAVLPVPRAVAQGWVTTPREALGFDIGDDYRLATYTQLEAYWRTLAKQSSRMVLREIGKTA